MLKRGFLLYVFSSQGSVEMLKALLETQQKKMGYGNSPEPWLSQLLMDVVIAKMFMPYSFISKLGMINSNYIKCCFRFKWDSNCTQHLIRVS